MAKSDFKITITPISIKTLEDLIKNPDYVSRIIDRLIEYHLFI